MHAAILAGGASTRMGTDKALVDVGGIPMIDHVARALRRVGEVFVVGRPGPVRGIAGIPDEGAPHLGPLSGVVAALRHVGGPIVVAGVDQPFLEPAVLDGLLNRFDGHRSVVPVAGGVLQVTCAIYPVSFLPVAERHLADGSSLWRALQESDLDAWEDWPGDGRSWWSIDTPEGVADALRRFGHPPM